ncbi:hypothetical protein CDIK_0163 [Cucumispora dikerogammari]|nr:hypothetical protein CDIK_0163 [Cucumispora dikerogammari]
MDNGFALKTVLHSNGIHHAQLHTIDGKEYIVISSGKKLEFWTFNENLNLFKSINTYIPVIYFSPYKTKDYDGLVLFSIDGQLSIYTFESNVYAHERSLKTRITSFPITSENRIQKIVNFNKTTVILFTNSLITFVFQQSGNLNIMRDEKYFLGFQPIDLLVTNSLLFILLKSASGRVNLYIYSIRSTKNPLTLLKVVPTQSDMLFGKNNVFMSGSKGIKELLFDVYITNINLLDQITSALETDLGVLYTTPRGEFIGLENKTPIIYYVFESWIDQLIEIQTDVFLAVSKHETSYLFRIIKGGYELDHLTELEFLENFPKDGIEILHEFKNHGKIEKLEFKDYLKISASNFNLERRNCLDLKINTAIKTKGKILSFFNIGLFILVFKSHALIYENSAAYLETPDNIVSKIEMFVISFFSNTDKHVFIGKKTIVFCNKNDLKKFQNVDLPFFEIIKVYIYAEILLICLNAENKLSLYKLDANTLHFQKINCEIPINNIVNIQYLKEEDIYLFISFEKRGFYVNRNFTVLRSISCHVLKEYVDVKKYNIVFKYKGLEITDSIELKTPDHNKEKGVSGSSDSDEDKLFKEDRKSDLFEDSGSDEKNSFEEEFIGVIELRNCLLFYGPSCLAFDGRDAYYSELKDVLKITKDRKKLYILTKTEFLVAEDWTLNAGVLIQREKIYNEEKASTSNAMRINNLYIKAINGAMYSFIKVYFKKKKVQKIPVTGHISVIKEMNNLVFLCHGAYISIYRAKDKLFLESRILIPLMATSLSIYCIKRTYFIYAIDISNGFTAIKYDEKLKNITVIERNSIGLLYNTVNKLGGLIAAGGPSGICLHGSTQTTRQEIGSLTDMDKSEKGLKCLFALNIHEGISCSLEIENCLFFGTERGSIVTLIPIDYDDWRFLLTKLEEFAQNFLFDLYDSQAIKYADGIFHSNIFDLDFILGFPQSLFKFTPEVRSKMRELIKKYKRLF